MRTLLIRLCGSALSFVLCCSVGNATPITIEPDDYALGAAISNSHVTLRSNHDGGSSAVTAQASPAGGQSFGRFAGGIAWNDCCGEPGLGGPAGADVHDYIGFGMFFHQEVDQVSLNATNWYAPGLAAVWYAFDTTGNLIGNGVTDIGNYGESFLVDVQLDGIWSLIIGGGSLIAAIEFDNLSFNTTAPAAVSVPEPGAMALLLAGLVALRLSRSLRT